MKKIILTLAITAISALSFAQAKYTITGILPNENDNGKMVRLISLFEKTTLDSTTISNNTFKFSGSLDKDMLIAIASVEDGSKRGKSAFVILENGDINVTYSETGATASGTPTNDEYLEHNKNLGTFIEAEDMDGYVNAIFNITQKNITNPFGEYMLLSSNYYFENTQTRALLNATSKGFKETDLYKKMDEQLTKVEATDVGKTYTDIKGAGLDGVETALSDYVGKAEYVLVDFWASWCGPCRKEMPKVVEAYEKYKAKGLEIVGVSLDSDKAAWENGSEKLNITWPQMSDLGGWKSELAAAYGVNSIPMTLIIDKEGKIIARGLHGEDLQNKLAELFD